MKTLKLEDKEALELYKNCNSDMKTLLEKNWGKSFFNQKITDKIKSWEDVVNYLDLDENEILPFTNKKLTKQQKSINAFIKIQYISEVLNEDWIPNFNINNEYKYSPYFKRGALGSSWVYGYYFWGTLSDLGFGFYYKTSELAKFAGETFIDIYNDYLPD